MTDNNNDTDHIDWNYCIMCGEYMMFDDDRARGGWTDERGRRRQCHRECALRNVVGGIGHLYDHNYWCLEKHDPDGGNTYRMSALKVDLWVREHGVPSA